MGHAAPPRRPVTPGWRLWPRANVLTVEFLEVVPETSCLAAQANDLIISSADRMDMTTRNIVSGLQEGAGCALGLRFRFQLDYKKQNDANHREHAEGSILAVPNLRLPHQEPLAADT